MKLNSINKIKHQKKNTGQNAANLKNLLFFKKKSTKGKNKLIFNENIYKCNKVEMTLI